MRVPVLSVVIGAAALTAAGGCGLSPTSPDPIRRPPILVPAPPAPSRAPHLAVTRILTFGDSLTEGQATPTDLPDAGGPIDPTTPGAPRSYPYKLQARLAARYIDQTVVVFNGGLGGERADEGQSRLVSLLDQLHPEVVVLMEGVNDLNGGATVEATVAAMRALIGLARARGLIVFVSTLPRQRPGGQRAGSVEQIVPFNQALAELSFDASTALVDIYPEITVDLLAPDGLHLLEAGNQVLADNYFDVLRGRLEGAGAASRRRAANSKDWFGLTRGVR